MKFRSLFLSLAICCFGVAAFANVPGENRVIAKVADQEITSSQIDMALASFPPQQRALMDNQKGRQALLQQLITFNLMAAEGKAKGLEDSDEFKKSLDELKKQQVVELLVQQLMEEPTAPVSDDEAKKFYSEHQDQFQTPESVRASHILLALPKDASPEVVKKTQEEAQELIEKIKSGDLSFEDAAADKSSCPSKLSGGDLDFFVRGQMVPPFEKAAFALKVGEMTEQPVRTDFGFHIIKVTDHKDAQTQPYDLVKDHIKAELDREHKLQKIENYDQQLRSKYAVQILDPAYETAEAK